MSGQGLDRFDMDDYTFDRNYPQRANRDSRELGGFDLCDDDLGDQVVARDEDGQWVVISSHMPDEHPVIPGTTVPLIAENNSSTPVNTEPSNPERPRKKHKVLRGVGIAAVVAYSVSSLANAFLWHKGLQGPIDTYGIVRDSADFYVRLYEFLKSRA